MGGDMVWKKIESKNFLDSIFFQTISPPCLGLCFFSELQNGKCSRYPFLQLFRTMVLDTHYGGLKASCIASALSKFHPSVGDGATYCTLYTVHCTLYTVHCTLYTVHTVHTVHTVRASLSTSPCMSDSG